MSRKIEEILVPEGTYRLEGDSNFYPLPWGRVVIDSPVLLKGYFPSSRGGHWYGRWPFFVSSGYGQYQPYLEAILSDGDLVVTSKRDFEGYEGAVLGGRIATHKWLYYTGRVAPTARYRYESLLSRAMDVFHCGDVVARQGHLVVNAVSYEQLAAMKAEIRLPSLQNSAPSRRRIFNHQFFGRCGIYYSTTQSETWYIEVVDTTHVVSPDHIDQPITLSPGWYVAGHPLPKTEVD